jgi:hypothetical protein
MVCSLCYQAISGCHPHNNVTVKDAGEKEDPVSDRTQDRDRKALGNV